MDNQVGDVMFVVIALFVWAAIANDEARKKRLKEAFEFEPDNVHGNAGFASNEELKRAGLFKSGGIRIGFSPDGKRPLFYNKSGHLLLVAAARTGKAFTILVTAILSLGRKRSLMVFDPKAELACICGHYLRGLGNVFVLNPFGIQKKNLNEPKDACYNPMCILDPSSKAFHALCDKLAEAICPDELGGNDSHWILSARLLISGIIAALAKYGDENEQNLVTMRDILTGAHGESVFEFCRQCMTYPDVFIRQKLGRFAAKGAEESRELNAVISTADTLTGFLGNEAIADSIKRSDFRFRDLKRKGGMSVFICLPLNMLDVTNVYFRLMLAAALTELLDEGARGRGIPVLCILDEASQIGALKALSDAWGMAAGAAGLQILAVYQDLSQIVNQFPKLWSTVIQNCGVTMWFGARDHETREFVSKLSGVREIVSRGRGVTINQHTGEPSVSHNMSQTFRPNLHPHEVGAIAEEREMWMFCEGVHNIIKATRRPYLQEFKGKYRDNPYFGTKGFWSSIFK